VIENALSNDAICRLHPAAEGTSFRASIGSRADGHNAAGGVTTGGTVSQK